MARTIYGGQIDALTRAAELCREGGCEAAVPHIMQRIRWMQQNDRELPACWGFGK